MFFYTCKESCNQPLCEKIIMAKILDLIGRIFISAIFLLSGINKIGNYDGTVGWMESFGLPGF